MKSSVSRTALLYAVVTGLWVLTFDLLADVLTLDWRHFAGLHVTLAVFTVLFLYVILSWMLRTRERAEDQRHVPEQRQNFLDIVSRFSLKVQVNDRHLVLLDLALLVAIVFLIFAEAKIFIFHVVFMLLALGAFFWKFRAFVWRTTLSMIVIAAVLLVSVLSGEIPSEEIFEIPALSTVLMLIYVIAGQRAQAVEALQERTDELSMLLETSGQVALIQELEQLLGLILDHLKTVVAFDDAAIFKLDGEVLTILARRGPGSPEDASQLRLYLENTLIGHQLLLDQETVIIPDVWGDTPLARDLRAATGDRFETIYSQACSWMAVPLMAKGQVSGVLALQYNQPVSHYVPAHADLVLGFANQAAVAIENARLYEQAQKLAAMEERQRLARDLHDAVSQTLFSASLSAEVLPRLWERNPDEGRRCLEEVYQQTRTALAEMRTLLLELRPAVLAKSAFGDVLGQLTEATSRRARLPVTLTVEQLDPLPAEVKVALYRISQEALHNVVKHAAASRVAVYLRPALPNQPENGRQERRALELTISDDGRGFDPKCLPPASMGLGIMQERAEIIRAELRIESQIGQGTQVVVVWPGARWKD